MSRHFALVAVTFYPYERRFRLAYPRLMIAQSVAMGNDPHAVTLAVETIERALTVDSSMADLIIPLITFRLSLRDEAGAQRAIARLEKVAKNVPAAVRHEIGAARP